MSYWSIFWRTFAQLFAPFVLVAMGAAQVGDYRLTTEQLVVGAVISVIGGLVAVGAAWRWGAATDAVHKAVRSVVEKLIAGAATLTVTTLADIVSLPRMLWPVIVGAIGAGVLTYFQNQGAPLAPVGTQD
jgi:hypothetical protein